MKLKFLYIISLFLLLTISCKENSSSPVNTEVKPLLSIKGTLNDIDSLAIPAEAKVYLMWGVSSGSPDYSYVWGEGKVDLTNNTFQIDINDTIPLDAVNRYSNDTNQLGIAYILLFNQKVPFGKISNKMLDSTVMGAVNDRAVIYRNGPFSASTGWIPAFKTGFNFGKSWYNPNPGFDGFEIETELTNQIMIVTKDKKKFKFPNWTWFVLRIFEFQWFYSQFIRNFQDYSSFSKIFLKLNSLMYWNSQQKNMKELRILNYFMVEVDLPTTYDPHFLGLIPKQREMITKLMSEGTISSYTLSVDRSKLWIVCVGVGKNEVENMLATFPLYEYFVYRINDLAFHNNVVHRMPELSLN